MKRLLVQVLPLAESLLCPYADFDSFSDKFSADLNTTKHLNMKLFIFVGIKQVLKFEFKSSGFWKF